MNHAEQGPEQETTRAYLGLFCGKNALIRRVAKPFAGQEKRPGTSQKLSLFLLAFAFARRQYFCN